MKSIVKRCSWMGLLLAAWCLLAPQCLLTTQCLAEDKIQWAPDFRTACGMAAEQRRLVLLHFYNDNCGPCVRLEQNVFSKPEVGEAIAQNYLAVKVHAGKEPQLASRYRVNQWPTDVFVTPSGLEVHRAVSPQRPADYIGLLNQIAQQTGVSAARQWKSNLGQISQNAAAATQRAAVASGVEINRFAQQASGEMQVAKDRGQQQWNGAASQFQESASQARDAAQQSTQNVIGAAQQAASQAEQQSAIAVDRTRERATQWSQQATSAVQSYQQQAGDSYRQFREQASGATQEIQSKVDAAKQTWNSTTQKTTQELGDATSALKNQSQQTGQSLLDRRSTFMSADTSPAATAATAIATAPPGASHETVSPASATQPISPTSQAVSPASATAKSEILAASGPQPTDNPWVKVRQPKNPDPPTTAATSAAAETAKPAVEAPRTPSPVATSPVAPSHTAPSLAASSPAAPSLAAPPLLAAAPASAPPPFVPAQLQPQPQPQPTPPVQPRQQPAPASAPLAGGNLPLVPASQAPPVALDGFCPVTLLETMANNPADRSAWKKGDRQFGAIHRGRTYLFASAEHQRRFLANPDGFAPALAGCDPVRYAERGEWVDGKRAYGIVTPDHRILLFADETSRNRFEQSPGSYTAAIHAAVAQSESGNQRR